GVQQDREVATQSDVRGEAQRGAEPELAREAAVADQERPAEGKGCQALTKRQRRHWDIDRHHTLAVGTRLLLEAEGPRQRLAENDEAEILTLEAQVRACRQVQLDDADLRAVAELAGAVVEMDPARGAVDPDDQIRTAIDVHVADRESRRGVRRAREPAGCVHREASA